MSCVQVKATVPFCLSMALLIQLGFEYPSLNLDRPKKMPVKLMQFFSKDSGCAQGCVVGVPQCLRLVESAYQDHLSQSFRFPAMAGQCVLCRHRIDLLRFTSMLMDLKGCGQCLSNGHALSWGSTKSLSSASQYQLGDAGHGCRW
jgi:hypothetical protein